MTKPFISTIGAQVVLAAKNELEHAHSAEPSDKIMVRGPGSLVVQVTDRFDEQGQCIGICGTIVNGPEHLLGLVANCFARGHRESWDAASEAFGNVLISPGKARRHTRFPPLHVQGSSCPAYPQYRGTCEIYVAVRTICEGLTPEQR